MIALLLITHFIADFLLQSREMGRKKSTDILWLLGHLIIQFSTFFIALTFFALTFSWLPVSNMMLFILLNTLIHGVIDWNIWRLYKLYAYRVIKSDPCHPLLTGNPNEPWKYWEDHWFYTTIGFDQLLHVLTLVYLASRFL